MKKLLTILTLILLALPAMADKGVVYNKNTGKVHGWLDASATFPRGIKEPWTFGVSKTAKGTEKNVSEITDLVVQDQRSADELVEEAIEASLDDTLSNAQKKQKVKELMALAKKARKQEQVAQ